MKLVVKSHEKSEIVRRILNGKSDRNQSLCRNKTQIVINTVLISYLKKTSHITVNMITIHSRKMRGRRLHKRRAAKERSAYKKQKTSYERNKSSAAPRAAGEKEVIWQMKFTKKRENARKKRNHKNKNLVGKKKNVMELYKLRLKCNR